MLETILRGVAFALLAASAAGLSAASAVLKWCRESQTATRVIPEAQCLTDSESLRAEDELKDLIKEVQHRLESQPDT